MQQTNRTLGWNVTINDWDNGSFTNNYIVHQNSDNITNGIGIGIQGENKAVDISNNVLYNLQDTRYFQFDETENVNLTVNSNQLTLSDSEVGLLVNTDRNDEVTFMSNNTFYGDDVEGSLFRLEAGAVDYEQWVTQYQYGSALMLNQEAYGYYDPGRDLDRSLYSGGITIGQ